MVSCWSLSHFNPVCNECINICTWTCKKNDWCFHVNGCWTSNIFWNYRCPSYPIIPPQCQLQRDENDICCYKPKCDFFNPPSTPSLGKSNILLTLNSSRSNFQPTRSLSIVQCSYTHFLWNIQFTLQCILTLSLCIHVSTMFSPHFLFVWVKC